MKKPTFRLVAEAFTLVELLVLLAGVAILVALMIRARVNRHRRATYPVCMHNLLQIGGALQRFSWDNNNRFPPQVSITSGGSMELVGSNSPALHFRTVSNYFSRDLHEFRCPADESKQPLTTNGVLMDRNVSYFLSVDATPGMTNVIQGGDRNLAVGGRAVRPGLFVLTTNAAARWTHELHTKRAGTQCGNILFADGHVDYLHANLSAAVQHQGLATNRLVFP